MTVKISPALKGLITAVVMIITALVIDASRKDDNPRMQYLIFFIYAAGILWTIISFRYSAAYPGGFAALFMPGFRCFIVVTLVMVVFTAVFIRLHPEFAEAQAEYQRTELVKEKNTMPAQIDEIVAKVKKQYAIRYISASIFGYLLVGAAFTAFSSFLFMRRI